MTDGIPTIENAPAVPAPKPAVERPQARIGSPETPKPPEPPKRIEPEAQWAIGRINIEDGDPEIAMKDIRNELQPQPNELETVKSEEEIVQRLQEQIPQYTKEATDDELDARRQTLREKPQLSGFTMKDTLVGLPHETKFAWVQVDKIVGRTMKTQDGWSDEIAARKGRVVGVAKEIINGDQDNIEHIFHPDKPMERIKVTQIPGPAGPMYYVDDGIHRVSGAMTAGVKEIPCEVKTISYPLEQIAYTDPDRQSDQIYDWEKKINLGLIDGEIADHTFSDGAKGKKLVVRGEVLPWIRTTSQNDLLEISTVYEQLYPGSLDSLPIPKEALLDPIANNFYMAGRFEEWRTINANEKIESETQRPPNTPGSDKQPVTTEGQNSELQNLSEEERQFLETSRNAGIVYRSLASEYISKGGIDQDALNALPQKEGEKIGALISSARTHQAELDSNIRNNKLTAADLLKQYEKKFAGIIDDPSKYNVSRLGEGMYGVDIDYESFKKLFPSVNAVAAKPKEGIPFILIRRTRDGTKREPQDPYLTENIPHEAHHILWNNAQKDGVVATSETDPFIMQAFLDFQDEVIARAVSNGKLHGNTILSRINDEARKTLEAQHPDAIKELRNITPELNDELHVLDIKLDGNPAMQKSDVILSVLNASSFEELKTNINRIREIANKTSREPQSTQENAQVASELDII